MSKIHVFIVGSKGIPARYGGFETFVERLTAGQQSAAIKYHVSCMNNDEKHFEYNNADCFNVRVPLPGAPGRIFHVGLVLKQIEKWVKEHKGEKCIVYILGCRIGPLLIPHSRKLRKLCVEIYCNPDGLEWKRSKWNVVAKLFLRYCEKCLVENSDLVICDSVNIEQYIKRTYGNRVRNTIYIAYGADVVESACTEEKLQDWYQRFQISKNDYYLIVGRFVPDNNYETMITEFMKSNTARDLVVITNVEKNKFYDELVKKTKFEKDKRVKFVGTVYDQELLKKIREEAFAYIHGHEVGGTNPSLLEALGSTKLNLLLDVGFNKEVARDSALYWSKEFGNLSELIDQCDTVTREFIKEKSVGAVGRIISEYNWPKIIKLYENVFENVFENVRVYD